MRFNTLEGWLRWQENLNPKEIDLGLDRVNRVLKRLGHPVAFDCPLILVAGTNGKGSIVAILEALVASAGLKVCSYTSPHIFHYNERIKIDRQPVADALLCEAFDGIDQARGSDQLTYFEFGTLAAIDLFFRQKADLVILEVGLGGRLDAVNIMEPDVSILSSVAIDHVDWLGDNREAIGYEKAGIFRAGKTVICGDEQPPQSVVNRAKELGCEFLQHGKDYSVGQTRQNNAEWVLHSAYADITDLPPPSLIGEFQKANTATAIVALQALQQKNLLSGVLTGSQQRCSQIMASALSDIQLSGRFQKIYQEPVVYVDVAHNPHAALALASQLKISCADSTGTTWAIVAMLADKDIRQVLQNVSAEIDRWCFAGLEDEQQSISRGLAVTDMLGNLPTDILPDSSDMDAGTLDELQHDLRSNQCKILSNTVMLAQTVKKACAQVLSAADKDDRIIIFGSFYTVATAMSYFSELK